MSAAWRTKQKEVETDEAGGASRAQSELGSVKRARTDGQERLPPKTEKWQIEMQEVMALEKVGGPPKKIADEIPRSDGSDPVVLDTEKNSRKKSKK